MSTQTEAIDSNRSADFPGSDGLRTARAGIIRRLDKLTDADNPGVALTASLVLGYIQVLWMGKPVHETALAPYYAKAGELDVTPDSWPTCADVLEAQRLDARAQSTNLTQLFLGVLIAAIVVVRVFIPTVQDAIASSNVSGTTKTILDLLSLFAALLLLVSLAAPLMRAA